MTPIRVLVVDDHPTVRAGLTRLLNQEEDMEVVATAASGEEALEVAANVDLDVVLMDLSMPGMGGTEATRQLVSVHPGLRVIMLTSFGGRDHVLTALKNGAVGFMVKDTTPAEILRTLRYFNRL